MRLLIFQGVNYMYAIVKTGGKQYKVAPGDKLNIEKVEGQPGDKIALDAICIVDGNNVEADPKAAAKTKVEAQIVEQFRGDKILVFKFKKRKNYKKLQGHRQDLTRVLITAVGSEKFTEPAKKAAKKTTSKAKATDDAKAEKAPEEKAEAKKASSTKTAAKKPAAKAETKKDAEAKAETKKADVKPADTDKTEDKASEE